MNEELLESLDQVILNAIDDKKIKKDQFMRLALSIRESQNYMKYINFIARYPKCIMEYHFDADKEAKVLENIWNEKRGKRNDIR